MNFTVPFDVLGYLLVSLLGWLWIHGQRLSSCSFPSVQGLALCDRYHLLNDRLSPSAGTAPHPTCPPRTEWLGVLRPPTISLWLCKLLLFSGPWFPPLKGRKESEGVLPEVFGWILTPPETLGPCGWQLHVSPSQWRESLPFISSYILDFSPSSSIIRLKFKRKEFLLPPRQEQRGDKESCPFSSASIYSSCLSSLVTDVG